MIRLMTTRNLTMKMSNMSRCTLLAFVGLISISAHSQVNWNYSNTQNINLHTSKVFEQCIDNSNTSLVVTGLTTSGCVRASAVDGLQHNFKVVIVEEATGDRDLAAHNANLYDLNAKYVDVLPLEETLQLL